jgi:hypothetical protein
LKKTQKMTRVEGEVGEARKKAEGDTGTRDEPLCSRHLMSVFLEQHDSLQIFPVFQQYQTSIHFLLLGWTRLIRLLKSL